MDRSSDPTGVEVGDRNDRRPRIGGSTVALAVVFVVAVPLWLLSSTPVHPVRDAWKAALAVVLVGGLRLSLVLGSRTPSYAQFAFWLFVYEFLGCAPMVAARVGSDPDTTPAIPHQYDGESYLLIALGLVAWEVAYAVAGRRRRQQRGLDRNRAELLVLGGTLCAVAYVALIGPSSFLGSRDGLSSAQIAHFGSSSYGPLALALATAPSLVGIVALLRLPERTPTSRWIVAVGLVCLLFVVNPVSGSRFAVGTVYLSVAVSLPFVRTRPQASRALLVVVAIVALVGFSNLSPSRHEHQVAGPRVGPVAALARSGDYDAFSQLDNGLLYVHENGVAWGRQALGSAAFFLPRAAWPGKPQDTGVVLANFRRYTFANLSAPLWAEAYINGGVLAVPVVFAAAGVFFGRRSRGGGSSPGTVVLSFYLILILRGSLLQATGFVAVVLLSSWWVSERKTALAGAAATPPRRMTAMVGG